MCDISSERRRWKFIRGGGGGVVGASSSSTEEDEDPHAALYRWSPLNRLRSLSLVFHVLRRITAGQALLSILQ